MRGKQWENGGGQGNGIWSTSGHQPWPVGGDAFAVTVMEIRATRHTTPGPHKP